jgi:hypothetical protein
VVPVQGGDANDFCPHAPPMMASCRPPCAPIGPPMLPPTWSTQTRENDWQARSVAQCELSKDGGVSHSLEKTWGKPTITIANQAVAPGMATATSAGRRERQATVQGPLLSSNWGKRPKVTTARSADRLVKCTHCPAQPNNWTPAGHKAPRAPHWHPLPCKRVRY